MYPTVSKFVQQHMEKGNRMFIRKQVKDLLYRNGYRWATTSVNHDRDDARQWELFSPNDEVVSVQEAIDAIYAVPSYLPLRKGGWSKRATIKGPEHMDLRGGHLA